MADLNYRLNLFIKARRLLIVTGFRWSPGYRYLNKIYMCRKINNDIATIHNKIQHIVYKILEVLMCINIWYCAKLQNVKFPWLYKLTTIML